jgi:hypothetical protein
MALVGLILLLLTGMGRQKSRRQTQESSPQLPEWQRWGNYVGLALVLVGLLIWIWTK